MADTADLGDRIELLSMDKHCDEISVGLYEHPAPDGVAEYLVHCYSQKDGVAARLQFITRAMKIMGDMEQTAEGRLRFACSNGHRRACQRLFLEAGKFATGEALEPRSLSIYDKKSGIDIIVESGGSGGYGVTAVSNDDGREKRLKAIAGGLRKLAEMEEGDADNQAFFACGQAHDTLIGLLLPRALNVRAVLREEDAAASRGVLAAPSAQSV